MDCDDVNEEGDDETCNVLRVAKRFQNRLDDERIRQSVQACLWDILHDVEIANYWSERVIALQQQQQLLRVVKEDESLLSSSFDYDDNDYHNNKQSAAQQYDDYDDDGDDQQQQRQPFNNNNVTSNCKIVMADRFVMELSNLSRFLTELEIIQQDHENLQSKYALAKAQLYQTQQELQTVKKQKHNNAVVVVAAQPSTVASEGELTAKKNYLLPTGETITTYKHETMERIECASFSLTGKETASTSLPLPPQIFSGISQQQKHQQNSYQQNYVAKSTTTETAAATAADIQIVPSEAEVDLQPATKVDQMNADSAGSAADVPHDSSPATVAVADADIGASLLKSLMTIALPTTKEETNETDDDDNDVIVDKILMHLFSYLDAMDIVHVALVNQVAYRKVDALFGLGDRHLQDDEDDNSTIDTVESSMMIRDDSTMMMMQQQPPPPPRCVQLVNDEQQVEQQSSERPSVFTTEAEQGLKQQQEQEQQQIDQGAHNCVTSIPTKTTQQQPLTRASCRESSKTTGDSTSTDPQTQLPPVRRNLFASILKPRSSNKKKTNQQQPSTPGGTSAIEGAEQGKVATSMSPFRRLGRRHSHHRTDDADATKTRNCDSTTISKKNGDNGKAINNNSQLIQELAMDPNSPITPKIAISMSKKLSDSQLSAICSLMLRLKQKDHIADVMWQENENVAARLQTSLAVQQFFIQKIQQLYHRQDAIKNNDDSYPKHRQAQQISSDQQVIAFLDARVQQLHLDLYQLRQETKQAKQELQRFRHQSALANKVMEDWLVLHRQRMQDLNQETAREKKVLFDDVHNHRAEVVALQIERDGYRQQIKQLHKRTAEFFQQQQQQQQSVSPFSDESNAPAISTALDENSEATPPTG